MLFFFEYLNDLIYLSDTVLNDLFLFLFSLHIFLSFVILGECEGSDTGEERE